MTEYKLHTFKALSLPSSIPCLPLSITFHFFLITHSSVLNAFRTFFFIVLFFYSFISFSKSFFYHPYIFFFPSFSTSSHCCSTRFPLLLYYFFLLIFWPVLLYISLIFSYNSSVSFSIRLLSSSYSPILLPLSHVFPLLLYFFPLMNNFVFSIWNGLTYTKNFTVFVSPNSPPPKPPSTTITAIVIDYNL